MPAAGGEPGVPCCLGVVVRVHVDPARSEKKTIGFDDAMRMCCGGFACTQDFTDDAVFKDNVGGGLGGTTAIHETGIADDSAF
ncbi:unannotated protein [freshwater metagenome]|uniref:Unannotated protein n=1 Tax=freshwater metagenome TaxID=449393 RepID=A0A6J6JNM4_9ZZZZ